MGVKFDPSHSVENTDRRRLKQGAEKLFERKKYEGTGDWRRLHNVDLGHV
jgi:hypothetical protein